jgi:hypothetical protein
LRLNPQRRSKTLGAFRPTLTRAPLSVNGKPDQSRVQSEKKYQRRPRQAGEEHRGANCTTENKKARNQQPAKDASACILDLESLK